MCARAAVKKPKSNGPVIRERTVTRGKTEYQYFVVDLGKVDGKRKFRNFRTKREAEAFVTNEKQNERRVGEGARDLTKDQLWDALTALDAAKGDVSLTAAVQRALQLPENVHKDAVQAASVLGTLGTLTEAAEYFVTHRNPKGGKKTVSEVVAEYIDDAESDDLRPASLQDLRLRLGRFAAQFGDTLICDVSRSDAQSWLKNLRSPSSEKLSAVSKRHYRTVTGGMFNFAIEHEYAAENPFAKKTRQRRRKTRDEVMPGILDAATVQKLLQTAHDSVPEMTAALAISCFAGVRTAEVRALDWKHVDLGERRITIPPEIAKRRSVRHIHIEDNLATWLAPYRKERGPIAPQKTAWRRRFDEVRKLAGIKDWPINAMRHSFASNHLAFYGDQNKTALELGHRDTDLLYNHYRALVKREDAETYWTIRPQTEEDVIRMRA